MVFVRKVYVYCLNYHIKCTFLVLPYNFFCKGWKNGKVKKYLVVHLIVEKSTLVVKHSEKLHNFWNLPTCEREMVT